MDKINGRLVKEMNLHIVRTKLAELQLATKPQLAGATGLSVVTINSLVKELLKTGELEADQQAPSTGGRPAAVYRFNYQFSLALILLFNEHQWEDEIRVSVVDLKGDTLRQEIHSIPIFHPDHLEKVIANLISTYPAIKIISIGIPGQVVDGAITVSSHERLKGFRMVETLEHTFNIPVLLENDVNAAVSGYCAKVEKALDQTVVAIYFPDKYPPGVGISIEGKIIKGNNGMAGEIKYLPINIDWNGNWHEKDFSHLLYTILQTLNAVLAPHQVVLYQNVLSAAQFHSEWKRYQSQHEMASIPEIILSQSFNQDYLQGIQSIALQKLKSMHL